jgi:8-oxo-dGTP pyrophosphatase MutT (NUDIX family)
MNVSAVTIFNDALSPIEASDPLAGSQQVGALCWRRRGKGVQVLLITSRETGRWVIPKGGIISGKEAHASAAVEAWEEAGVEGSLSTVVLGSFDYDKQFRKRQESMRCEVQVFSLRVERMVAKFPERGQRRRKWFKPSKAAVQVMEPALRALLAALAKDASPLIKAPRAAAP